jgi:hypothetical protein
MVFESAPVQHRTVTHHHMLADDGWVLVTQMHNGAVLQREERAVSSCMQVWG